jgi:MSHA pilin protein MshD
LSTRRSHRAAANQCGATLIELVISIVIISIAILGTLEVMRTTTLGSADPMLLKQATAIAEAYLEEILLKPFYDPDSGAGGGVCPTAEASRDLYDNVCDYNGLDDAGAVDQNGSAVAGLGTYRVRVSVDSAATLGALSGPADVMRADVRVTHSDRVDSTLSGYRTRY